jgi:hypothetical protein
VPDRRRCVDAVGVDVVAIIADFDRSSLSGVSETRGVARVPVRQGLGGGRGSRCDGGAETPLSRF